MRECTAFSQGTSMSNRIEQACAKVASAADAYAQSFSELCEALAEAEDIRRCEEFAAHAMALATVVRLAENDLRAATAGAIAIGDG
jgi:hypothetical protein